jgi:hypothetical protein
VAHNNKKTEAGRNERFNQPQGVRDFSLVDSPGGYRARLFGAVDSGSGAWTNEMAQGGTRAQRRIAICQSLNVPGQGVLVSNWVGQIDKLSSNSDGKGVLYVSHAPNIWVETWNNDFSDSSHHTLIPPLSQLFAVISQMKEGDEVVFSGTFFASDVDCVEEHSMGLQGSMSEPEFIFRFTSVKPMN